MYGSLRNSINPEKWALYKEG